MESLPLLIFHFALLGAAIAAEPSGLRDAISKHHELRAEQSRRLYGARIPATDPASFKFAFSLVDLNGDGLPDAIVLLEGPEDCGSGGCTLGIFRGTRNGFDFVSESTIAREPIRLLPEMHFGWRSFMVSVSGGGAKPCSAVMQFNGRKYPGNPSLAPCATRVQLKAAAPVTMTR